jgi:hypothetical protein
MIVMAWFIFAVICAAGGWFARGKFESRPSTARRREYIGPDGKVFLAAKVLSHMAATAGGSRFVRVMLGLQSPGNERESELVLEMPKENAGRFPVGEKIRFVLED